MTDYTGRLEKRPDGTLHGVIHDEWGWQIVLTFTRDASGYAIAGTRGEPPEALRIPGLDDVR